jgi:hypothetical protein
MFSWQDCYDFNLKESVMSYFLTMKHYAKTLIEHYIAIQGKYNQYGKDRAGKFLTKINAIKAPVAGIQDDEIYSLTSLTADIATFDKTGQSENDLRWNSRLYSPSLASGFSLTSLRGMFISYFTKPMDKPIQTKTLKEIQQNVGSTISDMRIANEHDIWDKQGLIDRKIALTQEMNTWINTQASVFGRSHGVKRAIELTQMINQATSQKDINIILVKFASTGTTPEADGSKLNIYRPSGTTVTSLRGWILFHLLGKDVQKHNDFVAKLNAKESVLSPTGIAAEFGMPAYLELTPAGNKKQIEMQSTRASLV